jgi:antitoxin PrlF
MNVGTITSKGQITIPVAIRELAGLEPGVKVEFVAMPDGTIHLRLLNATAEDFFNCLADFETTGFVGTDEEAIARALLADESEEAGHAAADTIRRGIERAAPKIRKPAA